MWLMQNQLEVPAADLRHLCLECPCGAKVILDLQGFRGMKLRCCPVCALDYDPRSEQDLVSLAKVHANAITKSTDPGATKYKLSFLIPAEQERAYF